MNIYLLLNSVIVGLISMSAGIGGLYYSKNIDINLKKMGLIFFIIGFIINLLINVFNLTDVMCDKKCGNILKVL
jgi:hypothetical protein